MTQGDFFAKVTLRSRIWMLFAVLGTAHAQNSAPGVRILPPTDPPHARNGAVSFTATVTDPDGNPVTCLWDFGSGLTASGTSVAVGFTAGGPRLITVRASDGKGGSATASLMIQVADPLTEWRTVELPAWAHTVDGAGFQGLRCVVAGEGFYTSPDEGANWQERGPLGILPARMAASGNELRAVGSQFDPVTTIMWGKSAVSVKGQTWSVSPTPEVPELTSVAYGSGMFVAVGKTGTILTAGDGGEWTSRQSPVTADLADVVALSPGFVACGSSAAVLTSPDGISWARREIPETWPQLSALAARGREVICVGAEADNRFWRSADGGQTWEARAFGLEGFRPDKITFGDGIWIAAEKRRNEVFSNALYTDYDLFLAVSTDGQHWEMLPKLADADGMDNLRVEDGHLWLYGYAGLIRRSGQLKTENHLPVLAVTWPENPVVRQESEFAAAVADSDEDPVRTFWDFKGMRYEFGERVQSTFLIGGPHQVTAWAADPQGRRVSSTKSFFLDDPLLYWRDIGVSVTDTAYASPGFTSAAVSPAAAVLAGGASGIYTVPVGSMTSPGSWVRSAPLDYTSSVTWRQPGFVAAGSMYVDGIKGAVSFSEDGLHWEAPQILGDKPINDITAAEGAYVAVGQGGWTARSIDGLTWNNVEGSISNDWKKVAFVGPIGLAAASSVVAPLMRSTDSGATWRDASDTLDRGLSTQSVFAAGGQFFIQGYQKLRQYSPQTDTWQDTRLDSVRFGTVQTVISHHGLLLAASVRYDAALQLNRRYLLISRDGIIWDGMEMPWTGSVYSLLSYGAGLIAAGDFKVQANIPGEAGLIAEPSAISSASGTTEARSLGGVQLRNTGADSLDWKVSSDVPWLAASPAKGSATAILSRVRILQRAPLPAGEHQGILTFSTPGFPNQTVTVKVTSFDDDFGSSAARAFPANRGAVMKGRIQTAYDEDWFVYDFPAAGRVTVTTSGSWRPSVKLIASDGLRSTYPASFQVTAGRYWIVLSNSGSGTTGGAYEMRTDFVPSTPVITLKSLNRLEPDGGLAFTFPTIRNGTYRIQQSTDLENWRDVGAFLYGTGQEGSLNVRFFEPAPAARFYRLGRTY